MVPFTLASLVAGALLALPGLARPPLHLLNHELASALSLAVFPAWLLLHRWRARRGDEAAVAWQGLVGVLALAVGVLAVHLPWDGVREGCRTDEATGLFLTTFVPVGFLATVLGVVAARWSVARTGGLLAAGTLLLVVHDVGQVLVGVRMVDPLLGSLEAFDQRADLPRAPSWFAERGWVLLTAALVWVAHRWRRGQVGRGAALSLAVAWSLGTLLFNDTLGLGWTGSGIAAELSEVHTTAHFRVHHAPRGAGPAVAAAVGREAEYQRSLFAETLGLGDGVEVDLWLFENTAQLERLTNKHSPHAFLHRVNTPWRDGLDENIRHELVHAYHGDLSPSPRIWLSRANLEGTAQAWETGAAWSPQGHEDAAALLKNERLPHLARLLSPTGFWSLNENLAYDAAGSFMGWLVLTQGGERFRAYNRSGDLEGTYGASMRELDGQWRAFLAEIPVRARRRAKLARAYDPRRSKGYLSKRCPKLGLEVDPPAKRAKELEERKAWAAAAATWRRMHERAGGAEEGLAAVEDLVKAGDLDGARALLDRVADASELDFADQRELRGLRVRLAAASGDADATLAALREDDEGDPSPESVALQALLQDPELWSEALALLAEPERRPRRRRVEALLDRLPTDPRVRVLYGTWGIDIPVSRAQLGTSAPEREDLDRALDFLAIEPGSCGGHVAELADAGHALARMGDLDRARRIARLLDVRCTGGAAALAGEELARRIRWEAETPR